MADLPPKATLGTFNPTRLTAARELHGLTMTTLANRLGWAVPRLSEMENGKREPTELQLGQLAKALAVPTAYLEVPEPLFRPDDDKAFYRSRSRIPVRSRKEVEWRAAHLHEMVEWLDGEGIIQRPWHRVPQVDAEDLDPVEAAREVRRVLNFHPGPINNMVRVIEHFGAWVFRIKAAEGISAFSYWVDGRPNVILTCQDDAYRDRFDSAHELGHLVMDQFAALEGSSIREQEARADQFAAELLVPIEAWRREAPRSTAPQAYLSGKRRWGVSVACLIRRSLDAGVLTEGQYRSAFVRLSQLGWRKSEPAPLGGARPLELPGLLSRALEIAQRRGLSPDQLADELGYGGELLRRIVDLDLLAPPAMTPAPASGPTPAPGRGAIVPFPGAPAASKTSGRPGHHVPAPRKPSGRTRQRANLSVLSATTE